MTTVVGVGLCEPRKRLLRVSLSVGNWDVRVGILGPGGTGKRANRFSAPKGPTRRRLSPLSADVPSRGVNSSQ